MTPEQVRAIFEKALSGREIVELARRHKVVERNNVIQIAELVLALALSARTHSGGRQADVLRTYEDLVARTLVRGTFYARFTADLEKLVEELLSGALDAAEAEPVLLPPGLAFVKDWLIVDSTTVRLHDALKGEYRGTGDYAALKVHKTFSIGRYNLLNFHLSPAHEHDSRHCLVDESLAGYGLLLDLGYASHDRLRTCVEHGVEAVIRLKTGWRINVETVHEGAVLTEKLFDEPVDFKLLFESQQVRFENGQLDIDVRLGKGELSIPLRLVALEVPGKGVCAFLTTLTRGQASAELVGLLYRLRWEIERDNKLNKSDFSMDDMDCRKGCSARTLVYGALLGSVLVNRVVHQDHREKATASVPATTGPMHARLVAMVLMAGCQTLATALLEPETTTAWVGLASRLESARDPNWRRRPSVLDTMLGFVAPPGRSRRAKTPVPASDRH
jgi:hypothetical protein